MRSKTICAATISIALSALAPAGFADGRNPGSVLIYPMHRSHLGQSPGYFTILSVTNSNLLPAIPGTNGGSTNVQFEYVNTVPGYSSKMPASCYIIDRTEFLTPADTLSVLTSCHNVSGTQQGYAVVTAHDPAQFKTAWSHNQLIGSEMIMTPQGGVFCLNAIPFESPLQAGAATDLDGDNQLDFDGLEYEGVPELLYVDTFMADARSSIALINLTGGTEFVATVRLDIWNDNEFPLSSIFSFKCWFEDRLDNISLIFTKSFLWDNTPSDPIELDIDCDGVNDVETGWVMINGLVASSSVESIPNPALLGAQTTGPLRTALDGGRLLWESSDKQLNGDFLKFGADDPELP